MSWRDWTISEYNIDNFFSMLGEVPVSDSYGNYVIKSNLEGTDDYMKVEWNHDKIISNEKYITCIFFDIYNDGL